MLPLARGRQQSVAGRRGAGRDLPPPQRSTPAPVDGAAPSRGTGHRPAGVRRAVPHRGTPQWLPTLAAKAEQGARVRMLLGDPYGVSSPPGTLSTDRRRGRRTCVRGEGVLPKADARVGQIRLARYPAVQQHLPVRRRDDRQHPCYGGWPLHTDPAAPPDRRGLLQHLCGVLRTSLGICPAESVEESMSKRQRRVDYWRTRTRRNRPAARRRPPPSCERSRSAAAPQAGRQRPVDDPHRRGQERRDRRQAGVRECHEETGLGGGGDRAGRVFSDTGPRHRLPARRQGR